MLQDQNDYLVLIGGESGAGKSASLMGMANDSGVLYLNCESGKKLPFKNKFESVTITNPMQIYEAFLYAESDDAKHIHTVVIDTVSFLMDMYESQVVLPSADGRKAWGDYAQYFKNLMQQYVATSTKNVIMLTHIAEYLDENTGNRRVQAPVKGALSKTGIEAYFSVVVAAKKIPIKTLEETPNDYLHITDEDRAQGYKHVFQTKITAKTTAERIRGPIGMFTQNEVYIDNDVAQLMGILREYYEG